MLIPQAQECISYQIPAFRLDGKTFFWFGAAANHCAIYAVPQSLANDFKDYDSSGRGTVRFQPDDPIPDKLLSKLVATMVEAIKPPRPKKREQPGSQRRKA